jgi:hypothetical protein
MQDLLKKSIERWCERKEEGNQKNIGLKKMQAKSKMLKSGKRESLDGNSANNKAPKLQYERSQSIANPLLLIYY